MLGSLCRCTSRVTPRTTPATIAAMPPAHKLVALFLAAKNIIRQQATYPNPAALTDVLAQLARLPPLVTSWEVEALKCHLAKAARGEAFCSRAMTAPSFERCHPDDITSKLKVQTFISLGAQASLFNAASCANWALCGIAESYDDETYMVYRSSSPQGIVGSL